MYDKRQDLLEALRKTANDLQGNQQHWRDNLSPEIRDLHGHLHRLLVEHLMKISDVQDAENL
jgi:hypothetical protein